MEHYYTDERNCQILIAAMKAHNIRKIIASPGTTNVCFVMSVQQDPFFEVYSAADERSAGYIACGLAAETGEVVALSCTGATASRNYMSAMTEAYYRKLPLLVITSSRTSFQIGHNIDQVTDRRLLPRDVAKLSVQMPIVFDDESEWASRIEANRAILELHHHGDGPVHINLETRYSGNFDTKELPEDPIIERISKKELFPELTASSVVILAGAHNRWPEELTNEVDEFCEKYNAVVVCDHTSNYKGNYRVLGNIIAQQGWYKSVLKDVDLIIDIGNVSASKYGINAKYVWRVNPDGEIRDTHKKLRYIFECSELEFFCNYNLKKVNTEDTILWEKYTEEEKALKEALAVKGDNIPFSNVWIAYKTAHRLPENSCLHLGIQNSLRTWNYFEVPKSVLGYSNTGGFGIDGCVSAAVGASLADSKKLVFCVVGDLAFFYDMNSLGNRHIGNNLRILVINNGKGFEFKLRSNPASVFGVEADDFIAAAGHYGKKSSQLLKHYAEDLGFKYLCASNKDEYMRVVDEFTSNIESDSSIVLEVFTDEKDEDAAIGQIWDLLKNEETKSVKSITKAAVRGLLGEQGMQSIRNLIKK